jgi:ribosomal protein S18 acetylase RimI-like enzyme
MAVEFAAVADNLRESFRVIAASRGAPSGPGEVRELPGVSIAAAGVTFQMFNAAFLSAPVESETELARRILLASAHFDTRGFEWAFWVCEGWMSTKVRRRSRQAFEKKALRHSVDLPGMVTERLLPPVRSLPQMDVRRVRAGRALPDFCGIGSACFHVPIAWFREVFDSEGVWERFAAYVGYVDGEPVSTAAVVLGGGVLGVYNVATLPEHQYHGYGEAVMRYALDDARRITGIERSILQSTPAGLRLYERMGYRAVTSVAVYST